VLFNEASILHLAYWIIGYVVIVTEGLICLYACHQRPYGEKEQVARPVAPVALQAAAPAYREGTPGLRMLT
jgi:hypothetical protein